MKNKKEKTPVPKEELLPGWVRLLLILGPIVLLVAEIVILAVYFNGGYGSGVAAGDKLNFNAEGVAYGVFALLVLLLIASLFVMQFVFAKRIFKKRTTKKGIVFNAISLVVGFVLAIVTMGNNFTFGAVQADKYKELAGAVESLQTEDDKTLATELLTYLKDNNTDRAYWKHSCALPLEWYEPDGSYMHTNKKWTTNSGCMESADCQYSYRHDRSVKDGEMIVAKYHWNKVNVYDIFVQNGLEDYLNGKTLTKGGIEHYEESNYAPTAYTCNYGGNTAVKPASVVGFTLTSVQDKDVENSGAKSLKLHYVLEFMFDSENSAIRVVETEFQEFLY